MVYPSISMQMMGKINLKSISVQNVAKMTNYLPKMGQGTTCARTLNGHNSIIFHPILTFDHTKMISSSIQIEALSLFVWDCLFWVFFAPRPRMDNNRRMEQKPPQKGWYMSWSSPPSHSSKSCFQNIQG